MIAISEDEIEPVRADPLDREAEIQHGEDEHAERSADDGARSAEERCAADHRRGNGVEHERKASLQGLDRVDPHRLENAGERSERAAEHEVADLDLPTLTPLSLAPSRLPPVATVWSPQRVRVSRIVMTTITPSAQYTVTYGEPPKNRKNVWPPGVSTGNAPEMLSVSPFRT